jgi:capsular polysaccharide biosynthesis protein
MDFFAAIRIVGRRWYVVVAGLILTAVAAFTVMQSVAPTYQASGSAMVVGPAPTSVDGEVDPLALNPYARFDGATSTLAAVAVQIMNDIEVREQMAEGGANADYQIGQQSSGPVISVVVIDPDEEQAIHSASLVLHGVNDVLDQRQAAAGAPEESRIRSFVVTEPTRSVTLTGARVRAFLAVAVLGAAASLSLAFVAEAIAQSRQRKEDELAALDGGPGRAADADRTEPLVAEPLVADPLVADPLVADAEADADELAPDIGIAEPTPR